MSTIDQNVKVIKAGLILACLCYGGIAFMAFVQGEVICGIASAAVMIVTSIAARSDFKKGLFKH